MKKLIRALEIFDRHGHTTKAIELCSSIHGERGGVMLVHADPTEMNPIDRDELGTLGFKPDSNLIWFEWHR